MSKEPTILHKRSKYRLKNKQELIQRLMMSDPLSLSKYKQILRNLILFHLTHTSKIKQAISFY